MARAPDPGGNFASEFHRRAACALPNPDEGFQSVSWMMARVMRDKHFGYVMPNRTLVHIDEDELLELIRDLEADGDCEKDGKGNWRLTKAGLDVLMGPNAFVTLGQTAEQAGRDYFAKH